MAREEAEFNKPLMMYQDLDGNLYITTEEGNERIRRITPDGTVITIFESTPQISLNKCWGIGCWRTRTSTQTLFLANSHKILKITVPSTYLEWSVKTHNLFAKEDCT